MKNQLLYTEVTTAIEALAKALRKYSGESKFCFVEVLTRDTNQDDEAPDLYTFRIHNADNDNVILTETGWIYRDSENQITKVERIGGTHD